MENNNKTELEKFKELLDQKLVDYKQKVQSELNIEMIRHIEYAKIKIEEGTKTYVQMLDEALKSIEEKRKKSPSSIWDRQEKFEREMFEKSTKMVIDIWNNFIKKCEANIK